MNIENIPIYRGKDERREGLIAEQILNKTLICHPEDENRNEIIMSRFKRSRLNAKKFEEKYSIMRGHIGYLLSKG